MKTLYTCLEVALRLLHPFMPFITEELWQRLPRPASESKVPSVMLAAYPQFIEELQFEAAAKEYAIILGCAASARSLIADYAIQEGADIHVLATAEEGQIIKDQLISIRALSGKALGSLDVLPAGSLKPKGCAISIVSSSISVFLDIGSRVSDFDAELQKLENKLQKAKANVAKQSSLLSSADFAEKVSTAVQVAEENKLKEASAAVSGYEETIEQGKELRIR
jgi:valyl-tRNA synthetase